MRSAAERQLPGWPEPAPLIRLTAIRRISTARGARSGIELPELAHPLQHAVGIEAVELQQLVLRTRFDERARHADPQHLALQPPVGDERGDGTADAPLEDAFLQGHDAKRAAEDLDERLFRQRLDVAE